MLVTQQDKSRIESAILQGRLLKEMTFNQRAWAVCARIPKGKVATYGDLAAALNSRGARAVGNAMNRNPYAPRVPCHRVVGSDGQLTGFAGGLEKKRKLLLEEGVRFRGRRVDLSCRTEKL